VGIDVHEKDNTTCFMDEQGNQIGKIASFANSLPGARKLEETIKAMMEQGGFESLFIATESTSFLDLHLVDLLSSSETLKCYNPQIFQFNPKVVKGFKKSYTDKDKTDPEDAFTIADRLRFGRLPEPYQGQKPYFPLQRLTRYRCHLSSTIAREKSYFMTNLFLKYSSFAKDTPFSNIFGATSQALITEFFSIDEVAQMPVEELAIFISKHGKNRFPNPQKTLKLIEKVARESYRIRPALANSVNLILASTLQNIRAFYTSLKEVDQAIEKKIVAFPNTLTSVKGLGPVYSAGIFSEIGDINRFSSQSKLAKFAGLIWRKTSSGNFTGEITRMTKSGNQYLRYYLIEAANSLRMHNQEYRNYYITKYQEVTLHQHRRALALTARKLVRLIFALLSKNQLYQPSVV
jgi:transposase